LNAPIEVTVVTMFEAMLMLTLRYLNVNNNTSQQTFDNGSLELLL